MINFWQQKQGRFVKVQKEEIDSQSALWVDARNVSREETVQAEYWRVQ